MFKILLARLFLIIVSSILLYGFIINISIFITGLIAASIFFILIWSLTNANL